MAIKALIFDIGNVLIDWQPKQLVDDIIPDKSEAEFFFEQVIPLQWVLNFDRGWTWAEAVADVRHRHPDYGDIIVEFQNRWMETIQGPIQGTVEIMQQAKANGTPVFGLSNFGAENFDNTLATYPFLHDFDDLIVSAHVGLIKPDPAIYKLAIERFNLVPEDSLFIDDRHENIKAAEALGIAGHLFTAPVPLRDMLEYEGVI